MATEDLRVALAGGLVIPAVPLMLREDGTWSERHQRALVRYYIEAGAGGLAVGVHSTQFAIREPRFGLFEPILKLVGDVINEYATSPIIRIAGICGDRSQALGEADAALRLGYQAGLLSLTAVARQSEDEILAHCHAVAKAIPIIGFYLQPAVGGRVFSCQFWRRFCEIENVVAIKIAPFNRYQTLDVVRAVIESQRDDIALYTGNDDNIIVDLLTPFSYRGCRRFIAGGLLGQWGVWTRRAVEMLGEIKAVRDNPQIATEWLTRNAQLTDANGVIFDAAGSFAGCIPGIMEVLRRQGLAPSRRCLDPNEVLSPGQEDELDRIAREYPLLNDDSFVQENLQRWMGE